jgi:hypothetical protein
MDVNFLLDQYKTVHGLSRLWSRYIKVSDYNRNIAEICLMASDYEVWEVYVCLMAFSGLANTDPNNILLQIPFESISKLEIKYPEKEIKFFNFALKYMRIDVKLFILMAYVLALTLVGAKSIVNKTRDIDCWEECLRRHDKDADGFWKCYYEERC